MAAGCEIWDESNCFDLNASIIGSLALHGLHFAVVLQQFEEDAGRFTGIVDSHNLGGIGGFPASWQLVFGRP